jgi:hypothetical protein
VKGNSQFLSCPHQTPCRLWTILSSYKRRETTHNNYCYAGKQMNPALLQSRFLLVCPALNDIIKLITRKLKLINLLWSSHFSLLTQDTDSFLGYVMMFCLLSTQHTFDTLENQKVNRHYSHKIFTPCCWKSPWMLVVEVLPYSLDHLSKVIFPFKF